MRVDSPDVEHKVVVGDPGRNGDDGQADHARQQDQAS